MLTVSIQQIDGGYYALGLRTRFIISPSFDIGLNAKGMRSFAQKTTLKIPHLLTLTFHKNTWGYEISLPLTAHLTEHKKWDVQLEPYLLKLDTHNFNIYGARVLVGYRF